jgi:hypothetical protein
MTRRGTTLVEVLMAIFIMAIGLLSLLTLFPLGVLSMAQAIKDDRTAHSAHNAAAIAKIWDLRRDPFIATAFDNPNPIPLLGGVQLPPASQLNPFGPSYPVYIDPVGCTAFPIGPAAAPPGALAGDPVGGWIPRRTPRYLSDPTYNPLLLVNPALPYDPVANPINPANVKRLIHQWCTLPDDITFGANGIPLGSNPNGLWPNNAVERGTRYSWAWMARRPRAAVEDVVEVSVVVYSGRSTQVDAMLAPIGETRYDAIFDLTGDRTVVRIEWDPAAGQEKPNLRRGGWILDASLQSESHGGYFYRVVQWTEYPAGVSGPLPVIDVELQTPLRGWNPAVSGTQPRGFIVIMDNVSEVFDRLVQW